jgi:hypothetical protein
MLDRAIGAPSPPSRSTGLAAEVIRVRRSLTAGHIGRPKNHERRDVDGTPDLVETPGTW